MAEKAAAKAADKDRWPFDPMQPGDHEPVTLPENLQLPRNLKHLEKQNPAPKKEKDHE